MIYTQRFLSASLWIKKEGASRSLMRHVRVCVYRGGPLDEVLQLGVAELQGDDVVQLVPLGGGRLVVAYPLGHGHLRPLLRADVHHVHHASAPWRETGRGGQGIPVSVIVGDSLPR